MTKKPNYVFDTDDELCHWGIPGQKWGNRRFQNEDGSLTPEGKERYGVGEARSKADAQKAKARISYNTQKYKADLKSKAKKDADTRHAKEERHKVKEWAKTEKLAKKEQTKIDNVGKSSAFKFKSTKNMSDDDLKSAIERLKLQSEYNKQYVLATQPNSALAKADRFFEGPTGKVVADIASKTIPDISKTAVTKVLENALDKKTKLEKEKQKADIAFTLANARKANAEAEAKELKTKAEKKSGADFDGKKLKEHEKEVIERYNRMFGKSKKKK